MNEFYQGVYTIVSMIPPGKVMSYGQISHLLGYPRRARQVGNAMKCAPPGLPCHRVVNREGRTVPGWSEQRELLQEEGVLFTAGGKVDMQHFCWRGES